MILRTLQKSPTKTVSADMGLLTLGIVFLSLELLGPGSLYWPCKPGQSRTTFCAASRLVSLSLLKLLGWLSPSHPHQPEPKHYRNRLRSSAVGTGQLSSRPQMRYRHRATSR
jgi:hypothetical protein